MRPATVYANGSSFPQIKLPTLSQAYKGTPGYIVLTRVLEALGIPLAASELTVDQPGNGPISLTGKFFLTEPQVRKILEVLDMPGSSVSTPAPEPEDLDEIDTSSWISDWSIIEEENH